MDAWLIDEEVDGLGWWEKNGRRMGEEWAADVMPLAIR